MNCFGFSRHLERGIFCIWDPSVPEEGKQRWTQGKMESELHVSSWLLTSHHQDGKKGRDGFRQDSRHGRSIEPLSVLAPRNWALMNAKEVSRKLASEMPFWWAPPCLKQCNRPKLTQPHNLSLTKEGTGFFRSVLFLSPSERLLVTRHLGCFPRLPAGGTCQRQNTNSKMTP